ncbi:MAG: adenosine nucleotide hydrolase NudE [candidate division WS6 bacterium OLB20]|uniref:Adenosine nucleotide hydrolase NudE n=1 Tax=candidate division WS6 bacterium OLB20 TaxID=1617426 RepID=A0A136LYR0_9BACT|nr:MAG: adenosine nucleotide hydrolase NudE [candidate division WS6 bacterium OLB20]
MAIRDMQRPTVFGISAVLKTEKGFLLIKELEDNPSIGKKAGMLSFPTGFCNPGEHPEDAAVREMLEETGYPAKPVSIIGFYLIGGAFGIAYEMELTGTGETAETDADVSENVWLDGAAVLAMPIRPAVAEIIRDYTAAVRMPLATVTDCR